MMHILAAVAPDNIQEEKQRFFADFTYNPQFTYKQSVTTDVLTQWGKPQQRLVAYSQQLVRKYSSSYQSRVAHDNLIIETKCRNLLSTIGVIEPIEINFIAHKVARCGVSNLTVNFQDRPKFSSEANVQATLNHEIQTHLLRNLNQKKQGWQIDQNKRTELVKTEEGLAVLHGMFAQPNEPFWRPCAYYLAVDLSLKHSFAEVFQILKTYGLSDDFAWRLCLRTKRGLSDTGQPGALTKDICYFEGVVSVSAWVQQSQNDPRDLYLGKISMAEVSEKKAGPHTTDVYLPLFLRNLDEYVTMVAAICKLNSFDQLY